MEFIKKLPLNINGFSDENSIIEITKAMTDLAKEYGMTLRNSTSNDTIEQLKDLNSFILDMHKEPTITRGISLYEEANKTKLNIPFGGSSYYLSQLIKKIIPTSQIRTLYKNGIQIGTMFVSKDFKTPRTSQTAIDIKSEYKVSIILDDNLRSQFDKDTSWTLERTEENLELLDLAGKFFLSTEDCKTLSHYNFTHALSIAHDNTYRSDTFIASHQVSIPTAKKFPFSKMTKVLSVINKIADNSEKLADATNDTSLKIKELEITSKILHFYEETFGVNDVEINIKDSLVLNKWQVERKDNPYMNVTAKAIVNDKFNIPIEVITKWLLRYDAVTNKFSETICNVIYNSAPNILTSYSADISILDYNNVINTIGDSLKEYSFNVYNNAKGNNLFESKIRQMTRLGMQQNNQKVSDTLLSIPILTGTRILFDISPMKATKFIVSDYLDAGEFTTEQCKYDNSRQLETFKVKDRNVDFNTTFDNFTKIVLEMNKVIALL
jgi:hypothetical protein